MIYAFHYLFRRLEALVIPRNSLLLATFLISATAVAAEPLPPVSAHTERISVSGLSSGAAMATQLSVAYSDRVAAVGMMAGPPYGCAQGASRTAVINSIVTIVVPLVIVVPPCFCVYRLTRTPFLHLRELLKTRAPGGLGNG